MDQARGPFSPDHEIYRRSVRAFLDRELAPYVEQWADTHLPDREFWRKAGRAGLVAPTVPEAYGGAGGDFLYHIVMAQELGGCPAAAAAGTSLQLDSVAAYIYKFGSETLKARWLPLIVSGEALFTVAMTESHTGSDLSALKTTAARDGDDYVLNGPKTYISGGAIADVVIIAAKTDPEKGAKGISLFLVEAGMPGFSHGAPLKKMGMNAADNVELFLQEVRVPASSRLGEEGRGMAILMSELSRERMLVAARALAEAQLAFDLTVEFVKGRTAFGQKVFSFQNTQFQLATLKADLTVGAAFLNQCLVGLATGTFDEADAVIAKLWITEMQGRVVDQCVQLHGGSGYMDEYTVSRLYTAARVTRIYSGTSEIMRMLIARAL